MNAIAVSLGLELFPLTRVASDSGRRVEVVFWVFTAICGLIALTVAYLVIVYCVRYRAGSARPRRGGSEAIEKWEIGWIGALTVLALGMFGWASKSYYNAVMPPADARTIYVVGRQWMWKAEHAGGRREINELHVPTGEPIRLVLTSQDVIHSFYVPSFRLKQDAVPGRYTTMWFTPERPGEYQLFCAEYCGDDHSRMRGRVFVMEPGEFQHWMGPAPGDTGAVPGTPGTEQGGLAVAAAGAGPGATARRGAFYELGCNACHIPGSFVRAPRLDGIWGQEVRLNNGQGVIADEQYIRESILNPNAAISAGYAAPSLMPTYQGRVTEDQLVELIEFIKSIRHGWPEGERAPEGFTPGGSGELPAPGGVGREGPGAGRREEQR